MFKGFAGLLVVALVAIAAFPDDVAAQKSSRILVSARVVSSVVPETHAAIDQQLSWLAQADNIDVKEMHQQSETARRFAQVSTARFETSHESALDQTAASAVAEAAGYRVEARITVEYTAN